LAELQLRKQPPPEVFAPQARNEEPWMVIDSVEAVKEIAPPFAPESFEKMQSMTVKQPFVLLIRVEE
jgi:hypothetical protein